MADNKRITLNLSASVYSAIQNIAQEESTTLSSVLRRAISVYSFFHEAREDGKKIYVEAEGSTGKMQQIEFLGS